MVIQPGLKALCEAEHPKRYVLFGGRLLPLLWQQCSLCSLEISLSSPHLTDWFGCQSHFGAFEFTSFWRTQNWDLGSGCAPGAFQLWMVTWVHSSGFFQAAWNHHLPTHTYLCWGCLELQTKVGLSLPDCTYCRYRSFINCTILWIHSYRIELLADTDIASAAFVDWKDWNCSSSDAIVNLGLD